jgi:hypothetical protein
MWADLRLDMQLTILADISLAELARLALVSKGFLALYDERFRERHNCIEKHLAEGWPPKVTQGLTDAEMAVPRDFVVCPPVCLLSS